MPATLVSVSTYGVFFFFQAEDGIRDWSVTGVQTCALPISSLTSSTWMRRIPRARPNRDVIGRVAMRSEERRVGKSVDLGGRRMIKKKKKNKEHSEQNETN